MESSRKRRTGGTDEQDMVIKKAELKAWNSGAHRAAIQISGSSKAYLEGIQVSRGIPSTEMIAGRTVAVLFWDGSNPGNAVIIAVYG